MPRQVPRKERRGPSGPPRGLHVHDRRATRPRPPPRVPLPATGSGTCDENDNPPRADRAPCDSVRAERSRSPVEPGPPAAGAARVFRDSVGPAVRPTAQGSPRRTHTLTLSSPQRTVQTPESTLHSTGLLGRVSAYMLATPRLASFTCCTLQDACQHNVNTLNRSQCRRHTGSITHGARCICSAVGGMGATGMGATCVSLTGCTMTGCAG